MTVDWMAGEGAVAKLQGSLDSARRIGSPSLTAYYEGYEVKVGTALEFITAWLKGAK